MTTPPGRGPTDPLTDLGLRVKRLRQANNCLYIGVAEPGWRLPPPQHSWYNDRRALVLLGSINKTSEVGAFNDTGIRSIWMREGIQA